MTQEEKQLLLKDLCSRLPYGVKAQMGGEICSLEELDRTETSCGIKHPDGHFSGHDIEDVKPYLRPMSSMTVDEMKTFPYPYYFEWIDIDRKTLCSNDECRPCLDFDEIMGITDWLNKNHFDYRGLIPMRLALEAPENMYKTE